MRPAFKALLDTVVRGAEPRNVIRNHPKSVSTLTYRPVPAGAGPHSGHSFPQSRDRTLRLSDGTHQKTQACERDGKV
jgi:hypothetical protein